MNEIDKIEAIEFIYCLEQTKVLSCEFTLIFVKEALIYHDRAMCGEQCISLKSEPA